MPLPQFLYFDLGNVLISFCHDRMLRQMAAVAGCGEERLREVLNEERQPRTSLQWQLERGDVSEGAFRDRLTKELNCPFAWESMRLAFNDIFGRINESLDLAVRLKSAGHRLGILSNTNALHWDFLTDGRYPELNLAFELHVTSFDARSLKPDPGIYDYAVQRAGAAPGQVFFVDDRAENVAGARAFGFDAELFVTPEKLVQDLRSRGVAW